LGVDGRAPAAGVEERRRRPQSAALLSQSRPPMPVPRAGLAPTRTPPPPTAPRPRATAAHATLHLAAAARPHPDKAHYGGEDAFFVSQTAHAAGCADGVGGWQESGVNPAWYARTLMRLARAAVEGGAPTVVTEADVGVPGPAAAGGGAPGPPDAVLEGGGDEGAAATLSGYGEDGNLAPPPPRRRPPPSTAPTLALAAAHAGTRLPGSATAAIVSHDEATSTLHGAVVGDAGVWVFRRGELAFCSPTGLHAFDTPFQLAAVPEHADATDTVDDHAAVFEVGLQEGDWVVVATDGITDNLHPEEAAAVLPDAAVAAADPAGAAAAAAARLVALAAAVAGDPDAPTPYAAAAAAAGVTPAGARRRRPGWVAAMLGRGGGGEATGGKEDDCTCVVGFLA